MRLAEAWLMRHAPGGSMPSQTLKHCKIQSRKDAPKIAILEAPCAQNALGRSTMRLPEALLPWNPTWESSHLWGLTIVEASCKQPPSSTPKLSGFVRCRLADAPVLSTPILPLHQHLLEKESIHRPAPVQNFSLQKKWGPQRKDFGFPCFYRVFVSTTSLKSFSLRPEKFSKRFSFGGGCVRCFFLATLTGNLPASPQSFPKQLDCILHIFLLL